MITEKGVIMIISHGRSSFNTAITLALLGTKGLALHTKLTKNNSQSLLYEVITCKYASEAKKCMKETYNPNPN